jgi:serine/threonine-protein kinase RsbW
VNVRTSTKFRRDRAAVRSARAFVNHALRSGGTPTEIIDRLELAVAEACNNAILHSGSDVFSVSVVVDGGRLTVRVADDGNGFDPPHNPTMPMPHSTGQRGLAIMRELVEHVVVSSTEAGTTVELSQRFTPRSRKARPAAAARAARVGPLIVET